MKIFYMVMLLVVVLGFIGWVMNIGALLGAGALVTWSGLEVLRVIGIFLVPAGAVMGWF